ncbi:MAG TPA: outer membrane protein transport protein [Rhodocyclaceae bacterium]|nr:outer membrane protein transport protein [Rhodocyclaceae bacterium]
MAQDMKLTMMVRSVVAAMAVLGAGSAAASGFQLLEQNASGLGNAYAGSAAVSQDASTIYFNPAGMTQLKPHEISLGANFIQPSYKFTSSTSSNAPAATGSNGGDAGSLAAVPNMYMSWGVTQDLYLGLGIGAPFGLKTEYDNDWAGRFQSTLFDIETLNVNPSIAWRANSWLSIGAGVNYMHMDATYERYAATANPALPAAFWPGLQNTKVRLNANDDAWGWNAGVLLTPSQTTKLGLSYRSAVKQELKGELTFSGPLAGASASTSNTDASTSIKLPDTFIISTVQQLGPDWEMLGDISWTGWEKIDQVVIARADGTTAQTLDAHFRNTWRVALGANYQLNSAWKLRTGLAWDQSPVRDASTRLTSLPDNNRLWLSLGTQWVPAKDSRIDVGFSYLLVGDADIDNNQSALGRGRVTGAYKGNVMILGAQYSQAF